MYICKVKNHTKIPQDSMTSSNKIRLFFLLAILAFAFTAKADDAHSKSVITISKARVITPISIENTSGQGLDFGVIALGTTESKVVVSAEASVPVNVSLGDVVVVTSTPQKAAMFTVSGEASQAYSITLPASAILTSGGNSLTINNFSCSNGAGGNIGTNDLFYVGGELTIPAGATPAVYLGTFSVTVAYN
jgi:hypothetical protein